MQLSVPPFFVAEGWIGGKEGCTVTTQRPTFLMVTEVRAGGVFGYVRKERKEQIEIKGEGIGWAALRYKKRRQTCIGVYVQPQTKLEELESLLGEASGAIGEGEGVVIGDFNAYHTRWANKQPNTRGKAIDQWAETEGLRLLNEYDIPTRRQTVRGTIK